MIKYMMNFALHHRTIVVMNKAKSGLEEEDYHSTVRKWIIVFHKTYSQRLDDSHSTNDLTEGKFHILVV